MPEKLQQMSGGGSGERGKLSFLIFSCFFSRKINFERGFKFFYITICCFLKVTVFFFLDNLFGNDKV